MGFDPSEKANEIAALRAGIEMGATVIDTAEMYASGGAEEVTGEAIAGIRNSITLVTKVLPSNASYSGVIAACQRSLRRLQVEQIDLYLLHWPSSTPIQETIDAFEELRHRSLIKQWGVSNFDLAQMEETFGATSGENCAVNQIYYSLSQRGAEFDLLPWQKQKDVAVMAYCPLDQGRLIDDHSLDKVAKKHNVTRAQVALAWLMLNPNNIPIPKSASVARTKENVRARDIVLDEEDIQHLNAAYPPPTAASPLKTA